MRKKMVECGRFGRSWGIKGGLTVFWYSGVCPVEIGSGKVYVSDSCGGYTPYFVLSSRSKGDRFIVSLEGIKSPEEAKKLSNKKLYVYEECLVKLSKGEYYCYQILGLNVKTDDNKLIGKVTKVFSTGSNDVYEVTPSDPKRDTVLIPAIDSVVIEVNIEAGYMIINPMEGMIE